MKKKILFILVLFLISFACLFIENKAYATTDLDEIENYIVTVDPRMTDGTLDITYEITWKVLDSTTEGPLSWVQIGTPNQNFDNATAITSNIKRISKYNGSYVKIEFDRNYYAGDEILFKYKIHQQYMYKIKGSKVSYDFTPAWFTDAEVKKMQIRWNAQDVTKSDESLTYGNYLIWNKSNMSKGEKLSASVEYNESAFTALDANKQSTNVKKSSSGIGIDPGIIFPLLFFIIFVILVIISFFGGGGYYGHRGFYYGGYYGRYRGRRMCT